MNLTKNKAMKIPKLDPRVGLKITQKTQAYYHYLTASNKFIKYGLIKNIEFLQNNWINPMCPHPNP